MISADDAPFVILAPSHSTGLLLKEFEALDDALDALPGAGVEARPLPWEDLPLPAFVGEASRLPLMVTGWPGGVIPEGDVAAGEILHELSTAPDIMETGDLEEALRLAVEGAGVAAEWRRITEAESVERLLKNDAAIGWSGFDVISRDEALRARLERRRMTVDHFRGRIDWTVLRGHDLLSGAILLEKALSAEMVPAEVAARWQARIAGEMLLRFDSWQALARSALLGALWTGLEESEKAGAERMRRAAAALQQLLGDEGAWTRFPWPRQLPDAEPPAVYGF